MQHRAERCLDAVALQCHIAAMSKISNVCVYCGSSPGNNEHFMEAATDFGKILAENKINLVYGGGSFGLMGALATSVLDHGGTVTGIIPEALVARERALKRVQEMVVTRDMHERKRLMFERSDAFVALPGGIGTLEEAIELLSWRRLDLHNKPIVFFNPDGFWDHLFAFFHQAIAMQLAPHALAGAWRTVTRVEDLLPAIREMAAAEHSPIPKLMPRVT